MGNASTSTAYPVTFPVVSTEHIAVAVENPAGATAVSLTAAQFTISSTGGGYEIRTATAWPATARVTVFRSVPFDQPFDFQDGGAILPSQIEQGFDRVVMQVQQLWRQVTGGVGGSILPGSGGSVNSVAVFANLTAQQALKPAYVGQWGVRLSDYTAWVGKSLTTGDWQAYVLPQAVDVWEVDPLSLPSSEDGSVIFERELGVIPCNFFVTHVRMSVEYNGGVTLNWGLKTGEGLAVGPQFATGVWGFTAGVYSILIPFASLNSPSLTQILPAGKTLWIDTLTSRVYGTVTTPVRIAFLGRWVP